MTGGSLWLLVALCFVGILALDAYVSGKNRPSMSRVLLEAAARRPMVAAMCGFVVGVLFGHFFWPLDSCLEALRKGAL